MKIPYHWSERSSWSTISVPHTPALYVRLFEPRSEVIGELGAPRRTRFWCHRPCDRLRAPQLDYFRSHGAEWEVLFAPRKKLSTPRWAFLIIAGGNWGYDGVRSGTSSGRLWLHSGLRCRHAHAMRRGRPLHNLFLCLRRAKYRRLGHTIRVDALILAWGGRIRYLEVLAAPEEVVRGGAHVRGSVAGARWIEQDALQSLPDGWSAVREAVSR